MSSLCILGRQPAIGLAELESLYGADHVQPCGELAALVDGDVDFDRLGGSVKVAKHLTTLDTVDPRRVLAYCRQTLPDHLGYIPEGKIKLGISLYGLSMPLRDLNTEVLKLKSVIKRAGRSARAIPNTEMALSSAQSYHNGVTSPVGLELVCVRDSARTHLGQVTHVQDIDSYTLRDRGRPKRDSFVGMLPPKLAQIIVNLASGRRQVEDGKERPANSYVVLDPFCGTGVILQEAALMGYDVYGTDLSEKMIEYSRANLEWLEKKYEIENRKYGLAHADATSCVWDFLRSTVYGLRSDSVAIATESFLGRPIAGQHVSDEQIREIAHECNAIMRGFLRNIAPQIPAGTRLCIAAPSWYIDGQAYHLPVIDELATLGYDRVVFTHTTSDQLVYRRDDQPVGRELVVLTRK